MKVETNSPTRESIQRTSRKMLSADDWAFQWNIDPNTARSMAYKGIPKVKNRESEIGRAHGLNSSHPSSSRMPSSA